MELSQQQQIFDQINKAQKILIALPQNLTADALGSGLGLRLFLLKLQKQVVLASAGSLPENLKFLPGSETLQNQIFAAQSLVVVLDTKTKNLQELSYEIGQGQVRVYLKPKNQPFGPEDVTFQLEKSTVNLIITLGVRSFESLGRLYDDAADMFLETPKINIDNQSANEMFGQVNLVDVTAPAVAEILTELLQKFPDLQMDQDIATALLTGIIAGTHSFQSVQTTPRAFLKASELVALGGRMQEIIKNIYKTKSLSLLRLWGRALARMKILPEQGVIYSLLNLIDFEKSESSVADLPQALEELAENISGYNIVALLAEPEAHHCRLLVAVPRQLPATGLLQSLGRRAKVLPFAFGQYQVIEVIDEQSSLENLEQRFLESLKNLPA